MHTFTPENRIFDGPIIDLLSILRILIEIISHAHAKGGGGGGGSLNDLKFGTFVGLLPSDGVASMAVKGLMSIYIVLHKTPTSVQYP